MIENVYSLVLKCGTSIVRTQLGYKLWDMVLYTMKSRMAQKYRPQLWLMKSEVEFDPRTNDYQTINIYFLTYVDAFTFKECLRQEIEDDETVCKEFGEMPDFWNNIECSVVKKIEV